MSIATEPRPPMAEQLHREAAAMAAYASAAGLAPSASVIQAIQRYEDSADVSPYPHLVELLKAHTTLTRLVDPAKPRTILMLEDEKRKHGVLSFLGPIPIIRQMMGAALISLWFFVLLGLSPHVNPDGGNILSSDGMPLLLNLLFFLSAAGLGASFHGLYKANAYLTKGNFDPTYHASYWIRFSLGLIAGLFLSVLISEKAFVNAGGSTPLLEEGIIRPLLAVLGGFSADLGYTILNRLVETVESLFRGSAKQAIENRVHQEKLQLEAQTSQQQMKVAAELLQLETELASGSLSEQGRERLKRLIADLVPGQPAEDPGDTKST